MSVPLDNNTHPLFHLCRIYSFSILISPILLHFFFTMKKIYNNCLEYIHWDREEG